MKRLIPNTHTIHACIEARDKFDKVKDYTNMNDAEIDIHNFNAGFNRGIMWAIDNIDKIETN